MVEQGAGQFADLVGTVGQLVLQHGFCQNGVTHIAAMADGDVPALAGTHTRKGGGLFKGLQHQGGGRLGNVKEIIGYRKSLSGDDPDRQNGKPFIL